MRRLILFLLCALLSVCLAFFLVAPDKMGHVVIYLSYPILIVVVGLWGFSLWKVSRSPEKPPALFPRRKSAWILIGLVTGFLLLFEPCAFKIV